jgi:copper chaperone CopZ
MLANVEFKISGMNCARCIVRVEKALKRVPGITLGSARGTISKALVIITLRDPNPEIIILGA